LDKKTHERDLKDFSFKFIELPKFKKDKRELSSYEDKWCYFFKHADDPEDMQELIKNSDEVIKKAYDELKTHNWTNEELTAYEASEKSARDAKARESYVREEGLKEGREEERLLIARNMLDQGLDISMVSESTGLSAEEIQILKR